MAAADVKDENHRFEIELEFVQCLANPFYLTHLAHQKLLEDERFLNYIDYLEYFRKPEYARLLTYPVYSLSALTLLKQPQFRLDIANPAVAQEIMRDMVTSFVPEVQSEATVAEAEKPAASEANGVGEAATPAAASGTNGTGNVEKRNGIA